MPNPTVVAAVLEKRASLGTVTPPPQTQKEFSLVTNRTHIANVGQSSGNSRQVLWRTSFWTAERSPITAVKLIYANLYLDATGEHAGLNPIYITAALEYGTTTVPVLFGGVREVLIPVGGIAVSDELAVTIPPDTQIWTRQNSRTVNTAEKYPTGYTTRSDFGEAFSTVSPATNLDATGQLPTPQQSAMYAPIGILGKTDENKPPAVAIIGSSSTFGNGETFSALTAPGDRGYLSRMVTNKMGQCVIACGSNTAAQWVADSALRRAAIAAMKPAVVINQLGTNDIANGRTAAQVNADLLAIWQQLAAMGCKVFQTTFTPRSSSTDGWTTTTGQTPQFNAVRTAVNDYIRSKPAPLHGVLEVADIAETARNSGIWKITGGNWTTDGIHTVRHADIAAALPVQDVINAALPGAITPQPTGPGFDLTDYDLAWQDDFDGAANTSPSPPWFFFDNWGAIRWRDTYYTTTDAYFDGQSHLVFRMRLDAGQFKTSYLQTYQTNTPESQWKVFGPTPEKYFECRCTFEQMEAQGPWVAFWLYHPTAAYDGDPSNGTEIDIMEHVHSDDSRYLNAYVVANHWGGNEDFGVQASTYGINIRQGWHTFGLHWTPTKLTYYFDGFQVWSTTNGVSTSNQQAIILSVEYEEAPEDPLAWNINAVIANDAAKLPDYWIVDYVKVYQKKPSAPSTTVPLVDWLGKNIGIHQNAMITNRTNLNRQLKTITPATHLAPCRITINGGDAPYLGYPNWLTSNFVWWTNLSRLPADEDFMAGGKTITMEPGLWTSSVGTGPASALFGRNSAQQEVDTTWRDRIMWKLKVHLSNDVGSISGADRQAVLNTIARIKGVMGPNEIDAPKNWTTHYLADSEANVPIGQVNAIADTSITLNKLLTRVADHMRHVFDGVRAVRPNDVAVLAPSLIRIMASPGSETFTIYDFMRFANSAAGIAQGDHAAWCDAYQIHNHHQHHHLPNPWTGANNASGAISAYHFWTVALEVRNARVAAGKPALARPLVDGETGIAAQYGGVNVTGRTDLYHLRQMKYGQIAAAKAIWGLCEAFFYTQANSGMEAMNLLARNGRRSLATVSVNTAGSGYAANTYYALAATSPMSYFAQPRVKVTSVNASGGITGVELSAERGYFNGSPTSPAALVTPSGGTQARVNFTLTPAWTNDEPHQSTLNIADYTVLNRCWDYRAHDIDLGIAITAKSWQRYTDGWQVWFDNGQAPLPGGPNVCPFREWNAVTMADNLITMNDRSGNRNLCVRIVQSKYVASVNPIVGRRHRFTAEVMLDGNANARGCLRVRGYNKLNGLVEVASTVLSGVTGWTPLSVEFTHVPHNNPRLPDPLTCVVMLDHNGTGRMQARNTDIAPV